MGRNLHNLAAQHPPQPSQSSALPPCVARIAPHVTVRDAVPVRPCRFLSAGDFTLLRFPAESRSALFLSSLSMAALAAYVTSTVHSHSGRLLLYFNRPAASLTFAPG